MIELFCAEARGYADFHRALRARAEQVGASREVLDEESGLADGYCAKILAPVPMKGAISLTALEPMLTALRLKIVLVDDHEAIAKRGELPARKASQVRTESHWRRKASRQEIRITGVLGPFKTLKKLLLVREGDGPRKPCGPTKKRSQLWNGRGPPKGRCCERS
jgi:hypothetical protein